MSKKDINELKAKVICYACVDEDYLSGEIHAQGRRAKCSYCGKLRRSYSIGQLAERIETVFEQHYCRTSDHPNDFQSMMLRDEDSSYEWERDGEPVVYAIMNAAEIPEEAAEDIQEILDDVHDDFDSAAMGEETEFADGSHYEERGASGDGWQEEWDSFEKSLRTEARFFSRRAAEHLASIFDGIDEMRTRDGRPLVVDAGPKTDFHTLYRARVFQSNDRLEAALCRPDLQLGSPPMLLAAAGRMNARGISVFYGANDPRAAIAEVRPPVGSQVAVAQFEILRNLRLLDLTALGSVQIKGSIFDDKFAAQTERATFLRSLSSRITRPVMPDDEPFDYLATQAIADFLATESSVPIDGIIYPSVQVADGVLNVVLFHKAAYVEKLIIPEGTEIFAQTGHFGEDGWEYDYSVIEETVPAPDDTVKKEKSGWPPNLAALAQSAATIWEDVSSDCREPTLRVVPDSIKVHQVRRVEFETEEFPVRRHRWEKRNSVF